ncbi:caspase family protein [Streptomyces sp. NPDC005898]|uniref:caspase family protein n=1 Tax=Streptomyces sp. NPDC005898 TaxID=3157082 RepID=UPI0033DDC758
MPQHKALLIGASEYDDPLIDHLPFIQDDLVRMRDVLTDRGFASVEIVENKRGIIPSVIHAQVRGFLRDARADDTLLILLSGHGHHFDGKDFLIPEDATFDVEPFSDSCVEIGWRKELEESRAGHVVFLVDACREGVQRDTKGDPPGIRRWSRRKVHDTLRRKVAYVYACSAAQQALFVRESDTAAPGTATDIQPGESFSLFSRAAADVIARHPHAMRLGEFSEQTQRRVETLHRAYKPGRDPQQLKVICELDPGERDFPLLPGPDRHIEAHPWIRSVRKHPVWQRTRPGPVRDTLHELCVTLAGRLAAGYEAAAPALREDPWHDAELALRAHGRLGFLARRLADDVQFSPSEAALAVLLPLVEQAFWAQEANRHAGVLADAKAVTGPDRDRFENFTQGFPRVRRRLRALEQAKSTDGSLARIRWWLFHRWLIQQPSVYSAASLKELLEGSPQAPAESSADDSDHPGWVAQALSENRLMRFLQEHRAAPFATPRGGGLRDHDEVAASTGDDHEVREPLVAALTKAAYAMAVDPLDLPEIVVEHLGISDSVDLAELVATVRGSDWRTSGMGRSLNAVCGHPAVQIALREHAARVDGLLRDINGAKSPALTPLSGLPPYADGSRVRLSENTPDQLSDGIRFQLAEDRVQELLMGEELYGERELAVRELYQNALDAVRYSDCRLQYLRRTGRPVDAGEGRIDFFQGIDDKGRPYLECRDNGIGMGIDELSNVFSQGGARFVDLPEYIEEQALWAELPEPRIELHPNSRFGIGVLSYFMLADEIVVLTCRLGRDGRPGRLLRVTIAGPGNLFRVEDLGPGTASGTSVKLLLTRHETPVSCVEALQRTLWVAPYRTTAEHGSRRHEWLPGELSPSGLERHGGFTPGDTEGHPSDDPDLWWVDRRGYVLADGLYAGGGGPMVPYGILLNLHGRRRPELSVDRRRIRSYDRAHAIERAKAAVPGLLTAEGPLPTAKWLSGVSSSVLPLADHIAEQARLTDAPWQLGDVVVPFSRIGFFPPDETLLPLVTGRYPAEQRHHAASFLTNLPEPVLRWRLLALYRAGLGVPLTEKEREPGAPLCARPSDLTLLTRLTEEDFPRWDLGFTLWLDGPDGVLLSDQPSRALIETGLVSLGALFPWRDPAEEIDPPAVFQAVRSTGLGAVEIVERLTALGYRTAPLGGTAGVTPEDVSLLRPLGNLTGWLAPGAALHTAQICVSAVLADRPAPDAARRLRELGFDVPDGPPERTSWTEEEHNVVDRLWDGFAEPPPPDTAHVLLPAQLADVAYTTGMALTGITRILQGLGFVVPDAASMVPALTDDDHALLGHDSAKPEVDHPVPLRYVTAVARRSGQSPHDAAARLRALGYEVAEVPDAEEELPSAEDIAFLGLGVSYHRFDEDCPLSLAVVAERAVTADITPRAAVARLAALGYECELDAHVLARLQNRDAQVIRQDMFPDPAHPVRPAELLAAALHAGMPYGHLDGQGIATPDTSVLAHHLTGLGYEVTEPSQDWYGEREAGHVLLGALSPVPLAASDWRRPEARVSLATLASIAVHLSMPFHDVALSATELGLRHEAQEWFRPESLTRKAPLVVPLEEPPDRGRPGPDAPWACAAPPP